MENVTWFLERAFSQISIINLTFVVLLQLLKNNLLISRDLYLHEMSLAILHNIAAFLVNTDRWQSERLIE